MWPLFNSNPRKVCQVRMQFDPGLKVEIGDPAWMQPSGLATNVCPNESSKVRKLLVRFGLIRSKITYRIGVVSSVSTYKQDNYCTVLVM